MSAAARFLARLRARELLVGTFVKTPHLSVVEVLAGAGLDVIALDAEHAPFDRGDLDACLLAARAGDLAALVRPAEASPAAVLNALDLGAAGVLAPHVRTPEDAAALARHARFGAGGRGFAGSTRAAGYGARTLPAHLRASLEETAVIAQIEDREAIGAIDAIAAVEGVDALFVGRIDLTVALGEDDPKAPGVMSAAARIVEASVAAGRTVGMFTPDLGEIPHWRALGASFFLLGSDHGFMRAGARAMAEQARRQL